MQNKKFQKIIPLSLGVIILSLFTAYLLHAAWTEPTQTPPGDNVATPINVSKTTQVKAGAFGVGGVFQTDGATHLAITSGNVGIGTTTPAAKLHIAGTPGVDGIMFPDGTKLTSSAVAGAEPCLGVPGAVAENCFLDVDGDGKSPGWGDCDELCPNCYVGFVGTFLTPDGHDNNCNGIVDEADLVRSCGVGPLVYRNAAHNSCISFCQARGRGVYLFTCHSRGANLSMWTTFDIETCSGGNFGRWPTSVCWPGTPITCVCVGAYN